MDGRPLQGASSVRGIGSYERGLLSGFAGLAEPPQVSSCSPRTPSHRRRSTSAVLPSARRIPVDPSDVATDRRHAFRGERAARRPRRSVPRDRVRTAGAHAAPGRGHRPRPDSICDASRLPVGPPGSGAGPAAAPARRRGHRRLRCDPPRHPPIHAGRSRAHHVIPEGSRTGVPGRRQRTPCAALRAKLGLDGPFLLAVGTFDPRKRIALLADVVRASRKEHDVALVIAGDQGTFIESVTAELASRRTSRSTHASSDT